jgi:F-type H+-transporting ATPase subunit b
MNLNFTLFAQAITFAAFIWFTAKFVWPPLVRAMEARQKTIADGLAAAELGKQELVAANQRVEQELSKTRAENKLRLVEAEKQVAQLIEEAKQQAEAQKARILAEAKAEAEQEVVRARDSLRAQVATLAVAGAEQILQREVNPQTHAELLARLSAQL